MQLLRSSFRWAMGLIAMSEDNQMLIRSAVGGDADALSKLLARVGPGIERTLQISPIWQATLESADVMQVTYLEAFLQIRRFDPDRGTSFEGWLARIAQNNLRDAIRGLERQKQPQPANRVQPGRMEDSLVGLYNLLGSDSATPSRNLRQKEAAERLEAAINAMPTRYREVVREYDLLGRSIEEVAAKVGRSPGAVHMLRARAHDCLREILAQQSMTA